MKDISRREILRGATLSGLGVVGVGSGVAAAAPHDDVLGLLDGDDGGGGGGGDGCDLTVDPSDPTGPDTIQEAVDQASAGTRDDLTTICVVEGTFQESVTVDKTGIAIIGQGPDETRVTSSGTTFQVTGADVLLFKLGIDGTAGTAVDVGAGTAIRNSRITAADTSAVTSGGNSFSVVQCDLVDENGFDDTGVAISATGVRGTQGNNDGIFVSNNQFTDFRHALELVDCKNVAIKRNTFLRSWYSAIQVEALSQDVELIYVGNNEFRNNTNAIIFYEDGDARTITRSGAVENVFRDYFWGLLTSTQKVAIDIDDDGDTEMVELAGKLDGGVVDATCNYWGRPTGPRADGNDLTVSNPVPGWIGLGTAEALARAAVPDEIEEEVDSPVPGWVGLGAVENTVGLPKRADMTVQGAVKYRPWTLEPPEIGDQVPGWFPPGGFLLPSETDVDCVGGLGADQI